MRPSLLMSPCSLVKVTSICELAGMVQVRVLFWTLAVMSSPLRVTWSSLHPGFGVKVKVLSVPSLMSAAAILLVMVGEPLMETEPLLLHEMRKEASGVSSGISSMYLMTLHPVLAR